MIVALLQVQHQGVLELQVPSDHTSVADIIQVLEEMKDGGVIQNYSVSQTTLDDVRLQSLFNIFYWDAIYTFNRQIFWAWNKNFVEYI